MVEVQHPLQAPGLIQAPHQGTLKALLYARQLAHMLESHTSLSSTVSEGGCRCCAERERSSRT